ncbi:MAG: OmpA family protein [Flavobacteriales bacterium]|nr:OmpA family protein [Flavobacteriales bacterium]
MVRIFVTFVFLLWSIMLLAQNANGTSIDKLHYADAIRKNEKAIKKNPNDLESRYNLAIAYTKTGQTEASFEQYLQLMAVNYAGFNNEDWNNIGQYALSQGLNEIAEMSFEKIAETAPSMKNQLFSDDKGYFKPFILEGINTPNNDFSPVIYQDQIVFTSDRAASVYDLTKNDWSASSYLSIFKYDTAEKSVKLFGGQLNQEGHNGPVSFNSNFDIAYNTHAFKEHKNSVNNSKIVIANFNSKNWKEQQLFEFGKDNNYSYAHPVFLDNLNMLVFSSDQQGGSGDMDLYYSIKTDAGWSEPINMKEVNTPFNEVFPCSDQNSPNSLYFSSNGYRGFGGLDIYKTTYENGNWTAPQLLPKAINSNYDDFGVAFITENTGYVSSNRFGGQGGDDIYFFERSNKFILEGYLVDNVENLPVPLQKIYIVDEYSNIIDSVFSNEEGYFSYAQLPYQSVGLMPPPEDGVEMVLRPKSDKTIKDPSTNIYLMSSKGFINDSIALDQPIAVTYFLEAYTGSKSRCVTYNNGDRAVSIVFNVKDENGNVIDKITTGKNGCFKLEKLYPQNSYLELTEEFLEMEMRIIEPTLENKEKWQDESTTIQIFSKEKCVEFEDGTPAVNIRFVVRDQKGNILDEITTNDNGCFNIRKLYDDDSYLDLMEEELVDLGMRLIPPYNNKDFEWLKSEENIILRYGKRCMVFKDGGHPTNAKYIIKDSEGKTVDGSLTDEEGCLKIKKLFSDDAYNVYVLDEQGLTYKAKMDTNRLSYLILDREEMATDEFEFVTITVKRCVEYEDGSKAVQVKFAVLSESKEKKDQFITDHNGCFTIHKLYDKTQLALDEEELVSLGMRMISGNENASEWYIQDDKIVLSFAEKCLTYENGKKASNAKYSIKTMDHETIESSITDKNGCLKMRKLYESDGYYIELLDEQGMTIRIPVQEKKEDKVVFNNIYFDFGKYSLTSESKIVLKDMATKMKSQPNLKVVVNAHTDSRGSEKINQDLSQKRADAVANYLNSQGVDKNRVTTKGYGESRLLNGCDDSSDCSDEDHALNRRIEFEFIWQ